VPPVTKTTPTNVQQPLPRSEFAAANQTTEPMQITSSKSTQLISAKNACIIDWSPNKNFPC